MSNFTRLPLGPYFVMLSHKNTDALVTQSKNYVLVCASSRLKFGVLPQPGDRLTYCSLRCPQRRRLDASTLSLNCDK